MKSKQFFPVLLMAAMVVVFLSCSKHKGFKKTADGLYYKYHVKGTDTTTIRDGMVLTLTMNYKIGDSVLFKSTDYPEEFMLPIQPSSYKGDIYSGMKMLHPGDSVSFIMSADSFFMRTLQMPMLPDSTFKGKDMRFDFKILKAQTPEQIEIEKAAELEQYKTSEPTKLAAYLQKNNIAVQPRESGLYYIETTKGNGQKPKTGDIVDLHFKVSDIDGKVLFSSYERGAPMQVEYGKRFDNDGATETINLLSKGGKATAIIPSEIAFGEQGIPGMIQPYSTLVYEIEMVDFMSKAAYDANEKKKIDEARANEGMILGKYLADNKITTKAAPSGLIYIEQKKGTGEKPVSGKTVKVHYTGTLLDGTKFDSSLDRGQPFEFVLGQGQVIRGWDEGIAMMNKGGKARLILPSSIAYGQNGSQPDIPPFSTLIFDVELIDIK